MSYGARVLGSECFRLGIATLLAASAIATSAVAADVGAANKPEFRRVSELIVLYNDRSPDLPARAEGIVEAVNGRDASPEAAQIRQRLQNPSTARLMLRDRLPDERRASLSRDNPREILHRYVVLTYQDPDVADAALRTLLNDPNIESVEENAKLYFSSTVPNDPLAATVLDENHQWGLSALNMYSAWDKTQGHGYVGLIDNGVQWNTAHSDLGQVRAQFSINYGLGSSIDEADYGSHYFPFVGHGTHTAGLIAATTNNAIGGAGTCWNCSIMYVKANAWTGGQNYPFGYAYPDIDVMANALSFLSGSGAEVVNMSFGNFGSDCSANPSMAMCTGLLYAENRDVIMVAAGGNDPSQVTTQFPARDSRVLAVGGIQMASGGGYGIWWESSSFGSSVIPTNGVVGPAKNIFSTFYTSQSWNDGARCADAYPDSGYPGFGWCTGTSMAAPQIAGLAALLRSINPLLNKTSIRNIITNSADHHSSPNTQWGAGIPNARSAVDAVLTTTNRLSPLFAFYGSETKNYFYTTVPQMGSTALSGDLLPYITGMHNRYDPVGNLVNATNDFSGFLSPINYTGDARPRAQAWIFTTQENPISPSVPLIPLYRLSFKCGDAYDPVCYTYPYHADHTYATNQTEVATYISVGYKLDGIEGYIYPSGMSQPTGTVALYRFYNSSLDDHAIFPATEYSAMASAGYNDADGMNYMMGWVYPNTTGSRPTY